MDVNKITKISIYFSILGFVLSLIRIYNDDFFQQILFEVNEYSLYIFLIPWLVTITILLWLLLTQIFTKIEKYEPK